MANLSFKDYSDLVGKWITIIGAISGGAIWLSTYVHSKQGEITERQKQSIELFKLYNSEVYLNLRQEFSKIKKSAHDAADPQTDRLLGSQASDRAEKIVQDAAVKAIQVNDKGFEMRRLIEFFDQVAACDDIGVCDKEVAYRFFGGDAYELRLVLKGFVDQVGRSRPGFGKGVDMLAYNPQS